MAEFDFTQAMDSLARAAHPDGGWGYAPGQPGHLEPTCFALLALSKAGEKYREQINGGLKLVEANRFPDGSYRLQRGRPQAIWPTSLVIFTRAALRHDPSDLAPSIDRLLHTEGRVVPKDPETEDMVDIDLERIGWPWAINTFSWVEPTAWACLALRSIGKGTEPRTVEGLRLLIDRAFDEGGINYGNRLVLGKMTEPIPTPTALMLLTLQGYTHPRVRAASSYLLSAVRQSRDLEHLAWAVLASSVTEEDAQAQSCRELRESLTESFAAQTAEGRPIAIVRHALSLLALDAEKANPFRLRPENRAVADLTTPVETPTPHGEESQPGRGVWERVRAFGRGVLLRGMEALRQPPAFGSVHIAAAENYDLDLVSILKSQYEHYRPFVPMQGKRVVLKPNLVEWHRNKVINTNPRFVSAVIQLCQAEGASEVIVAEGPGHWRNVEFLVEESGLGEVLRQHNVRFVDLNHDEPVKTLNLGRTTGLEYLYLTRTITTADVFISLPKLKTHHWAGATLSLKNLFGTMPGICYGWPKNELHWRGIPNSIIDIALTQTPHLAFVDGITSMEGDGPLNGKARHLGVLVMGMDLVAVDSTCCRLIGLDPARVPTLVLGAMKKLGRLGEEAIPQIGEPISKFAQKFELPPKIENQLLPPARSAERDVRN